MRTAKVASTTFTANVHWNAPLKSCDEHGRLRDPVTGRFRSTCREFEVTGTVSPFVPAYITGLPENCYPAEGGEVEISTVTEIITSGRGRQQNYESVPSSKAVLEQLDLVGTVEDLLADQAHDYDPEDERDWDAEREAREEMLADRLERTYYDDCY